MTTVKDVLNVVLQDNASGMGGVSFDGETVGDMYEEAELSLTDSLEKLNTLLTDLGIKPITHKKGTIKMLKQINEKHLLPATSWSDGGYIDNDQVNQELSYYMASRPRIYGGCYVYQYITMKDGTVYELSSMTASSRGIVARHCNAKNVLQRKIKNLTSEAIQY